MPKSKEQKQKEAHDRKISGLALDVLRGVYRNTPYCSPGSDIHVVMANDVGHLMPTAYPRHHEELVKAYDVLALNKEVRDYIYAGISNDRLVSFSFYDIVDLFTDEEMIVFAISHPINFDRPPAGLGKIVEVTMAFFREYKRYLKLTKPKLPNSVKGVQ